MPIWMQLIIGVLGLALTFFYKVYKEKRKDESILHTAPDDPDGVADIDKREQLQNDSISHPKP